jgi:Leu/Phe-tRNA-protein transferase
MPAIASGSRTAEMKQTLNVQVAIVEEYDRGVIPFFGSESMPSWIKAEPRLAESSLLRTKR